LTSITDNLFDQRTDRLANARKSVRRFFRDPKAVIAVIILVVFVTVAVTADLITPYGQTQQSPRESLEFPSWDHLLGTDRLGRDLLDRIIYGTRVSVSVGLIAVGLAAGIGVPIGLISGYFGGWTDEVLMRLVDAWIAFPQLILLLAIVSILGPGVVNVMVAIGLSSFPVYARLVRGQTLSVKTTDYMLAARALGATDLRMVLRHVLPNTIQPVIVQASLLVGAAVLAEAGLTFLGIGVNPPQATWGVIIQEGFQVIRINPLPAVLPGIGIILFTLAANFLGDRMRDVLDPRMRGST
jgi:peptide/nickel transport system permease protein